MTVVLFLITFVFNNDMYLCLFDNIVQDAQCEVLKYRSCILLPTAVPTGATRLKESLIAPLIASYRVFAQLGPPWPSRPPPPNVALDLVYQHGGS